MYFLDFNANDYDWLSKGLFKILLLIAVLQLVKKIPDIINTIFGTKIQPKGGIKGRLGEMAGIGSLAQKAWTSLGTGAKNLAKAGIALPAGAAFKGADMLYQKKTGKHLMDNKVMRQAKGIGSGLASAWKTGSASKAFSAYTEGIKAPSYTATERMKAQQVANNNVRNAVGGDIFDSSGNVNNTFTDKKGKTGFVSAGVLNKANDALYNTLETKYGEAGKEKARQMRAQELKTGLDGITAKQNAAMESLSNFATFASRNNMQYTDKDGNNVAAADKANTISNKIRDGNSLDDDDYLFLKTYATDANISDATAQYRKLRNESMALKTRFGDVYNGSTSSVDLGILSGKQDGIINDAQQRYDIAKEKMSIVDQDSMAFMEKALNNSFKTLNGAYQNNGTITPIFDIKENRKDASGNIVIDPSTGQAFMDPKYENIEYDDSTKTFKDSVSGNTIDVDKGIEDYVRMLKEGIITTSAEDYFGQGCSNEEVASFNDAVEHAKAMAEAGTTRYYQELHAELQRKNPTNARMDKNIRRINKSNLIP